MPSVVSDREENMEISTYWTLHCATIEDCRGQTLAIAAGVACEPRSGELVRLQ